MTASFPRGMQSVVAHGAGRVGRRMVKVPDVFPRRIAMTNGTVGLCGNVIRCFPRRHHAIVTTGATLRNILQVFGEMAGLACDLGMRILQGKAGAEMIEPRDDGCPLA